MKLNTLVIVHGPKKSGKRLIALGLEAKNFLYVSLDEGLNEADVEKYLEAHSYHSVGIVLTCENKDKVPHKLIELANTVYEISTQQTKSRKE